MYRTTRIQSAVDTMVDCQDNVLSARVNENIGDFVDEVHNRDVGVVSSPKRDVAMFEGDTDFEPRNGIEFESHEAAYSFYQEYAKSMGFTTSIKNSRRSKKSKEFIDAKFACSRYGVTPESDSGSSRRPSVKKTDCKASMHVKRRADGKWIIHEFIKDHNHELLPALAYHFRIHRNVKLAEKNNIDILHAVSERTRKMYVEMSRQSGGYQNLGAIELSEEGSLSEESYSISFRALVEALKNCVNVNNISISAAESSGNGLVLREEEESRGSLGAKTTKKKSAYKKRKVPVEPDVLLVEPQDSLQQMDNLSSDGMTLTGYYGAQQNVQGLLNLMEPPHDGYYVNQHSIQGLGQLNSIAPSHDGFFGTQQSMHGLGQLDFRPPANFSYSLQDEPHLRTTQLHGSASRHA
ncbi:protein far-red impaired response 1 [Quercus suber]|uniref:Protein far-red impaired response 1 n=1 Tax=Quercus suber TaxID=58331 RepID=A0AAW0JDB2_QUESU